MQELWVVEYSRSCDQKGLYPWHITTASAPVSELAMKNWDIVFSGSAEEAWATLEKLVSEWEAKKPKHTTQKVKERNKMTPSLRYEILKRDGFKCQTCGHTKDDGAKLHVDHIRPVSDGGLTVRENLRTLCEDCNRGKAARPA